MNILEQIDKLMVEETISEQGYNISRCVVGFSKYVGYHLNIYSINSYGEEVTERFKSKKDAVNWLKSKGFKIYEENKS